MQATIIAINLGNLFWLLCTIIAFYKEINASTIKMLCFFTILAIANLFMGWKMYYLLE